MPLIARQFAAMVDRLTVRSSCTDEEKQRLAASTERLLGVKARTDLIRQGERPKHMHMLIDGYAARYKLGASGERQIMQFHLPGEVLDFHINMLGIADHSVLTLGTCRLARIPRSTILGLVASCPGIARSFWIETLIDASITREWMLNIGRRDTYSRVAHLICELAVRMEAIGRCHGHRFDFPVTQTELGDAMGVTAVHMNRTIQALRADRLVSMDGHSLAIHDWDRLSLVADFDPTYLYLDLRHPADIPARETSAG